MSHEAFKRRPRVIFVTTFELLNKFRDYLAWRGYRSGTEAFNDYMRKCVIEHEEHKEKYGSE